LDKKKLILGTTIVAAITGGIAAFAIKKKKKKGDVEDIGYPTTIYIKSEELSHANIVMEQLVAKLAYCGSGIRSNYIIGDKGYLLTDVHDSISDYNGEAILVIKDLDKISAEELLLAMRGLGEYSDCGYIIILANTSLSDKLEESLIANDIINSITYEIYETYIRESNKYQYTVVDNNSASTDMVYIGTEQLIDWIISKDMESIDR